MEPYFRFSVFKFMSPWETIFAFTLSQTPVDGSNLLRARYSWHIIGFLKTLSISMKDSNSSGVE